MFWVTDLQQSSHDIVNASVPDTSIAWHVLPVESNAVPNVWIDSVWFDAPVALTEQPASVHVRINHNSKERVEGLPLTLSVDGTKESIGSYHLVPGIPTDTILRFTHGQPGPHRLTVALEDAPVTFDDVHHLGYNVASSIDVFHWFNADDASRQVSTKVDQAIQSGRPLLALDRGTSLPAPQLLAGYDFVIVDALTDPSPGAMGLLWQFVQGGGSVFVIPDLSGEGTNAILSALDVPEASGWFMEDGQVDDVRWSHPLYKGVFRSIPSRVDWPSYDRIMERPVGQTEEILISTPNGRSYLSFLRGINGQGDVYILGTPLETGNLTRHGLFVPSILRMAESSRQAKENRCMLGRDGSLILPLLRDDDQGVSKDLAWGIEQSSSNSQPTKIVPEVRTVPDGIRIEWGPAIKLPGSYLITCDGQAVACFGMNHRPFESELETWTPEAWERAARDAGWKNLAIWSQPTEEIGQLVQKHIAGERLAWYFFLVALVALAIETLLLRTWNTYFS